MITFTWPRVEDIRHARVDIKQFCSPRDTEFIGLQSYYIQINQIPNKPGEQQVPMALCQKNYPKQEIMTKKQVDMQQRINLL